MHSIEAETSPKWSEEDFLISGRHSRLIPKSESIGSDQVKESRSMSMVREAFEESVRICLPEVSF